jgi:hypothetical protein
MLIVSVLLEQREIHSQAAFKLQFLVRHLILFFIFIDAFNVPFKLNLLAKEPSFDDPCNPSPCGANANCNNGQCTCIAEYPKGDPYQGCRPECIQNSDCPREFACIKNKCSDPCIGICGSNALCEVFNHVATCSCPQGMSGNPFFECRPYQCKFKKKRTLLVYLNLNQS